MFPSAVLLFVVSALFSTSNAADHTVQVGQGGLKFSPDHVTGAAVGDTITFQFLPGGHTATQGTLATPCAPFAGGFDSGTRAGAATADAANTFQVKVNATAPIWVYCKTPSHCPAGMVFAVNPASDAQLAQFQQNAVNPGAASSSSTGGATTSAGATTTGSVTTTGSATPTGVPTTTGGAATTGGPATNGGATTTHSGTAGSAQLVPALLTVLVGSFGALLM